MHNLKLQPENCEFLKQEITYLAHRLTPQGLFPASDKVIAVKKFPIPTNPCQLKGLLGLAVYYGRFIPNFSSIANPLTELLTLLWGTRNK
jgi:hypothetical protein